MRFCWWNPQQFLIGRHTRAICARLSKANEDWRDGKSTFLLINTVFRHGKSDINMAFEAFFLGSNADRQPSVISTGYSDSLVKSFSRKVKMIIQSKRYRFIFQNVRLRFGSNSTSQWQIADSVGVVIAHSLNSSLVGHGGHLIIVDDYAKNLGDMRSEKHRNNVWNNFKILMTRRNPPAQIVLVVATPWHVDDIRGRIKKAMEEDANFPRFEELSFPAKKEGEYDYLFPEMYPPEWYDQQRATLGRLAAAQLDCDPRPESGERFDVSKVKYHSTDEHWHSGRDVRFWDLASSKKERDKDDPDWTWGIKGHMSKEMRDGVEVRHVWISSMVACQAEAPQRDALIKATAVSDGAGVRQFVEAFGGYKDAFTSLEAALKGVCMVHKSQLPGDKGVKAAPMETIFDAGNVHVLVGGCPPRFLDMWKAQFLSFPNYNHDDAVDATSGMYHSCAGGNESRLVF